MITMKEIREAYAAELQLQAREITKYVYWLRDQGHHKAANKRTKRAEPLYRMARELMQVEPRTII